MKAITITAADFQTSEEREQKFRRYIENQSGRGVTGYLLAIDSGIPFTAHIEDGVNDRNIVSTFYECFTPGRCTIGAEPVPQNIPYQRSRKVTQSKG